MVEVAASVVERDSMLDLVGHWVEPEFEAGIETEVVVYEPVVEPVGRTVEKGPW